jgi:3-deoxy-D-manno-octulosonic-acid transferase
LAASPLPADDTELQRLRDMLSGRPVWLAASTHEGEEALILTAHQTLLADHPGLLTIIAPRHPERGATIAGAAFRSRGDPPPSEGAWVVDTLGEMGLWYRLAPITFVGRSLLPPGGGQNPLEPARLGCAIAVGPHTGNFADHVQMLRSAGALTVVQDAAGLAQWVDLLLRDPSHRQVIGEAARGAVQRHADLPHRTATALLELMV